MPIGSLRLVTGSSYRAARRRETRALRALAGRGRPGRPGRPLTPKMVGGYVRRRV